MSVFSGSSRIRTHIMHIAVRTCYRCSILTPRYIHINKDAFFIYACYEQPIRPKCCCLAVFYALFSRQYPFFFTLDLVLRKREKTEIASSFWSISPYQVLPIYQNGNLIKIDSIPVGKLHLLSWFNTFRVTHLESKSGMSIS